MTSITDWIMTIGDRYAGPFSCFRTHGHGLHIDEVRTLRCACEHQYELGRPDLMGGTKLRMGSSGGVSAHTDQHTVAVGHEDEESRSRFARVIDTSFNEIVNEPGVARLVPFAFPTILEAVRKAPLISHENIVQIDLNQCELNTMTPSELARHPQIIARNLPE